MSCPCTCDRSSLSLGFGRYVCQRWPRKKIVVSPDQVKHFCEDLLQLTNHLLFAYRGLPEFQPPRSFQILAHYLVTNPHVKIPRKSHGLCL